MHDGNAGQRCAPTQRTTVCSRTSPLPNVNTDQLMQRIGQLEAQVADLGAKLANCEKRLADQSENGGFWDKLLEEKSKKLDILIKKATSLSTKFPHFLTSSGHGAGLLDIVICNIPEVANEDTKKVARAVLESVEPTVDGACVTRARRVTTSSGTGIPLIKATVNDEKVKGQIIKAARTKRLLVKDVKLHAQLKRLTKGVEEAWKAAPPREEELCRNVYINESTSRRTRQLLDKARKLRVSGLVERAWTFRDNVFVRVSSRDRPLCIRHETDLEALGSRCQYGFAGPAPLVLNAHVSTSGSLAHANPTMPPIYNVPISNSFSALSGDEYSSTPIKKVVDDGDPDDDLMNTAVMADSADLGRS